MKVIEFTNNMMVRITDEQYEALKLAIDEGKSHIEIGNGLYDLNRVYMVIDEEAAERHREYLELEANRKAGNWKCQYGNWHSREYKDCSCVDVKYRDRRREDGERLEIIDETKKLTANNN